MTSETWKLKRSLRVLTGEQVVVQKAYRAAKIKHARSCRRTFSGPERDKQKAEIEDYLKRNPTIKVY
jgi:hypothetical protein